jgi:hypothetical protein
MEIVRPREQCLILGLGLAWKSRTSACMVFEIHVWLAVLGASWGELQGRAGLRIAHARRPSMAFTRPQTNCHGASQREARKCAGEQQVGPKKHPTVTPYCHCHPPVARQQLRDLVAHSRIVVFVALSSYRRVLFYCSSTFVSFSQRCHCRRHSPYSTLSPAILKVRLSL